MKMPSFRDLLKKLSVLRQNSTLLVAIIIAVAAIVLFIPTQLISSKLKKQVEDESVAKGKRVQSMDYVSEEQWKEEEKYQESYANDANQIKDLMKQSTQRELLSYKIFPDPRDTSVLIFEEFGRRFRTGVEELIARINASDCPSDEELDRSLQSSSIRRRFGRRSSPSGRSLSFSRFFRGRALNEIDAMIVDEICQEKAKSASVYAHPDDVSGYEFWREYEHPGREEAVKDCWYWQLGYWTIEDVVDTIAAMNTGSNSVFKSPVKRLLKASFSLSERRSRRSRGRSSRGRRVRKGSSGDKPSYLLSVQDGLTEACTARFSEGDIDVIHFNVVVVVRTDAVLPFMKELCSAKQHKFRGYPLGDGPEQTFKHNQITILESSINPIDPEDQTHGLYRYGEDAVVELDLICEYIFNKTGYDDIQPETIKEELEPEEEE